MRIGLTDFIAMPRTVFAIVIVGITLLSMWSPVMAERVAREQDIVDLRLGQRILVEDGSCPAGQVKEISGAKMTSAGIFRVRKCIPRLGPKTK